MKLSPVRAAGYLLLAFGGWAAGRWMWPARAAAEAAGGTVTVQAQLPERERRVAQWEKLLEDMPGEKLMVLTAAQAADPAEAGREMKARAGEEGAADLLRGMARQMALLPPPALEEFLRNAAGSEAVRAAVAGDAVVYAFSRNPRAGLALLSSMPDGRESAAIARRVLRFFPPDQLPEVLGWHARLPAGEVKTAALSELVTVLKWHDFNGAAALVSALPDDGAEARTTRRELLKGLFVDSPGRNTAASIEAKLAAAPADERDYLRAEIKKAAYQSLAIHSREEAVPALAGLPENERGVKAVELFQNWAQSDPVRAVQGLTRLPGGLATPGLYSAFAKSWAGGNVGMASQWVHGLPDGPLREAAAAGLAEGLAKDYPAEAMAWAAALTDPAGRRAALGKVIAGTPPESLSAALSALDSLNLPPEEKAAVSIPGPSPTSVPSAAGDRPAP